MVAAVPAYASPAESRERYAAIAANPVQRAAEAPVSTFSVDVDTGSYSNVRRMLNRGYLPPLRSQQAIGYAELKRRIDPRNEYVPVRLGELNAQTRWVLERAGAPGGSPGCQLRRRQVPAGTPSSRTRPLASVFAWCGVSTTTTQATIVSWMLQPSVTGPGLSNTTGFADVPEYSFSSKAFAGENE